MEKKSDLLKRIEELEAFVEQQKKIIDQLILDKQMPFTYPPLPVQQGDCPMGGWHDYPNPWHSITAPSCKKCGHIAPDMTPTYTTSYNSTDKKDIT